MIIHIDKVVKEQVYFTTEYGQGEGVWQSENKPVEKDYFVEFDIEGLYEFADICKASKKQFQIKMLNGKVNLTLLLLEYDNNGCATFRFGDSLIEMESKFDNRFLLLVNSYVTVCVKRLCLYDEAI